MSAAAVPTRRYPRARVSWGSRAADVWRHRELLRHLVLRNLRVKYQRSLLGFLWTLLNPLLAVGILVAVFGHVVKVPIPAYWAFVLSGYFVWNFAMQMVGSSSYIFAEHAALRRSVAFPNEILVLSSTLSRLVEFAGELAIALSLLVLLHHHGTPASFVLLPVLVLLMVALVVGVLLPVATLAVFYHDVQHVLPAALLMLFYASPVFYPAHLVPEAMRTAYFLNPFAGLLTLFQTVLYEGRFPTLELLGGTAAAAVILCLAGYAIFARYQRHFAELL
jgi:ABC-type polysaccharide/polyol phosphate export permease